MNINDEVKVKGEFKKMLAGMPEFSEIDLTKTMTVVGFEWPKVLVKENSKKWRVSWLEITLGEVKESGKKTKEEVKESDRKRKKQVIRFGT